MIMKNRQKVLSNSTFTRSRSRSTSPLLSHPDNYSSLVVIISESESDSDNSEDDLDDYNMLTQNTFDRQKAVSNHWFFSYIPSASAPAATGTNNNNHSNNHSSSPSFAYLQNEESSRRCNKRYTWYALFFVGAILALYVNIAWVHPAKQTWYDTTRDAYNLQHDMAIRNHTKLAQKYQRIAHWESYEGQVLRANGAQGLKQSELDSQNATEMHQRAYDSWQAAEQDKADVTARAHAAAIDQQRLEEYQRNATLYERKAHELEVRARSETKMFWKYHNVSLELFAEAQQDEELRETLLQNATWDGQVADNVTKAAQNKEDHLWICQWSWTRQTLCSAFGGYAELGKADALRQEEAQEYQKAMGVQKQLLVAQTDAMIARTKALRAEQDAKSDHTQALKDQNASHVDEIKASEAHAAELQELQAELEAMRHRHEHLHELVYYENQEVKLSIRAKKENEYAIGQWRYGTDLLKESEADSQKAAVEDRLAKEESARQRELVDQAKRLGVRLRLYAGVAAGYALLALMFFILALATTNTVALGYQMKSMAFALAMTVSQRWHSRSAYWEGRSILGGNETRNQLRRLSCWCHHGLIFVAVMAMLGDQLEPIFDYDDLYMRGEILLQFALLGGLLETMLFQGIPYAIVTESLSLEFFKNVSARLLSSTTRYAIQMLLLLVLFGQESDRLFGLIHFLEVSYIFWVVLLVVTSILHYWYIEIPYALSFAAGNNIALSDLTFATCHSDITIEVSSLPSSRTNTPRAVVKSYQDEEEAGQVKGATIATVPAGDDESESLLTANRAQVVSSSAEESMMSLPYSSISLGGSNEDSSGIVSARAEPIYGSPELQNLYAVSFADELYSIVAHVELLLLVGALLVICYCLPNIAHNYRHPAVSA